MSTPIIEQIAVLIAADIDAITVANGYNQDLVAVRPKKVDFESAWDDLTVLVSQDTTVKDGQMSNGMQQWRQTFFATAIVIDSDTATTAIDTRLNQVAADIQKILMADDTRGGKAIDTIMIGSVSFDDDDGLTGVNVVFDVLYRSAITDPYTQ